MRQPGTGGSLQQDKGSRLAGIEALRAVAALSILVYHVWLYAAPDGRPVDLGPLTKGFDNLRAGVTLFFVLSGFLLYRVFVVAALGDGQMPSIRAYARNRTLRIVPAYWAILLAVAIVFEHRLLTEPLQLLANLLFLQNYVPDYAPAGDRFAGIAPSWSVVIEVSFYAVLPLLGLLAIRLRNRVSPVTAVLVPVLLMAGVGLVSKVWARTWPSGDALSVFQHSLPTHADWFAAGMAVAVAHVLWQQGRFNIPRGFIGMAAAFALLLGASASWLYYRGVLNGLEQQTPIAVASALALAVVVFSAADGALQRRLADRRIVFLGLASYSIFLVHDPLVRGLREWGLTAEGRTGFLLNLTLVAALSVALASASYVWIERPALARKRRWQPGDAAGLGPAAPPAGGKTVPALVPLRAALDEAAARLPSADGIRVQLGDAADLLVPADVVADGVTPLLSNALSYGATPVRVTAERAGSQLRVTVEDVGRGIDDDFVPLLFQPHRRSARSANQRPGQGLGLSEARERARQNDGDVVYEPHEGPGARFVLVLGVDTGSDRAAASPSGGRRTSVRSPQRTPAALRIALVTFVVLALLFAAEASASPNVLAQALLNPQSVPL